MAAMKVEAAAARERERLATRRRALVAELEQRQLRQQALLGEPQLVLLSAISGLAEVSVRQGLLILFGVAFELGSGLGLVLAEELRRRLITEAARAEPSAPPPAASAMPPIELRRAGTPLLIRSAPHVITATNDDNGAST